MLRWLFFGCGDIWQSICSCIQKRISIKCSADKDPSPSLSPQSLSLFLSSNLFISPFLLSSPSLFPSLFCPFPSYPLPLVHFSLSPPANSSYAISKWNWVFSQKIMRQDHKTACPLLHNWIDSSRTFILVDWNTNSFKFTWIKAIKRPLQFNSYLWVKIMQAAPF